LIIQELQEATHHATHRGTPTCEDSKLKKRLSFF
jgi:hypothetical protein